MHELAVAESVVESVLARTGERQVTTVRVRVGRLSGVVSDALLFCWDLATAGTPLEEATLRIDAPTGRAHCRDCESDFAVDDLILLCACGSADVEVLAGRELQVLSVEVA
jgi:hydrogenase nickel incorporation protein HypA/HybF